MSKFSVLFIILAMFLFSPVAAKAETASVIDAPISADAEAEELENMPDKDDVGQIAKMREVCEITGKVAKMEVVQRSPWTDGTPTSMTTQELHMWVIVENRTPRNPLGGAENPCKAPTKNEVRTYKVCSPTQVRPGFIIHGTEGTETGSSMAVGCLFDIAVVQNP